MAGEVAELKVRITGDAASLESTISGVEKQLKGLEQTGKLSESTRKALDKVTTGTLRYRDVVNNAKTVLDEKNAALIKAEKAYASNEKKIKSSISSLTQEREAVQNLVVTKQDEIKSLEQAGKSYGKNSKAYKENQKAIQWTQTELSALTQQYRDCDRQISAQEALLTKESDKRDLAVRSAENAEKTYNRLSSSLEQVEKAESALQLQKTGAQWKKVGEDIDAATKPLQYAALGLAAGGVASAKFAIDFEDNFAAVKKTVEGTPEQLEKVKQGIIDLSTVGIDGRSAIPQTTAELTALAAAGGQLGIETDNIVQFTETMAMLGTATNLVGEQGAQTLARFMNVAGVSQDKISNLGSSIVDLGNNFATTEAEIADMAMNLGATGKTVGISAQDILAYSTALSSMGVEAEAGGSAVSRIWIELQTAVSTGNKNLAAFAKLSGKSAEEFKKQWGTDASGAFQDFLKGLNQSEDQIAVLSQLGFNNIRDIQALQKLAGEEGFNLLTKAIQRSNAAWEENSALQREFDAKAATTASQIQLMKNNLVEAARSIGETFLPDIANATTGIKDFAQKIANMDEGTKQSLITTGKWVIGLGAASKGIVGATKGIGGMLDAAGKIKGAFSAGGVLAKFAPALTSVGTAAPYAAAGIAAVGLAVYAGKKSYDAWYDSQYRWTKGLSKGNKEIQKSMEDLRELDSIQQEIKAQKLIIENPASSQEQVDNAKARIEEIKQLLSEEYHLVIKSDNSNLEETVEQLKTINENDVQSGINNQMQKLQNLQPKYDEYKSNYAELEKEAEAALDLQTAFSSARLALQSYHFTQKEGESYEDASNRRAKERRELVAEYFKDIEGGMDVVDKYVNMTGSLEGGLSSGFATATSNYEKLDKKLKNLTGSYEEYRAVSTEIANWQTELVRNAALEGNAEKINRILPQMGTIIKSAGLDLNGYAIATAQAMNGVNSLEDAWKQGGTTLNGVVQGYIKASTAFGASAQETATGAALIANGFRTAEEAAKAGALETVSQQATKIAHDLKAIPENKKVSISASGNVSIIDETVEAVQKVENEDVEVSVNADGNINVLTEAGEKTQELNGKAAYMTVNAEGNIEVFDQAGQKIADIDGKTGVVNVVAGDTSGLTVAEKAEKQVEQIRTFNGTINVSGNFEGQQEVGQAIEDQNNLQDKSTSLTSTGSYPGKNEIETALTHQNILANKNVTYTVNWAINGSPPSQQAKGTQNFPGGIAMINDQKGISDPRELVEFGGKGYIFEGKDVVLPLPKGAKVWTASQTKAIMAGRGIPRYAKGKNNEAWDAAQEDWRHYTKINNVSAAEELAHWDEMLKKFANDAEVVKEIQEEIVDSTKKMWDETLDTLEFNLDMGWMNTEEYYRQLAEYRDANFAPDTEEWRKATLELHKYNQEIAKTQNEDSLSWIEHMGNANDWEEIGDSMSAAYTRVMERNDKNLADGILTLEEYEDVANDTFTTLLDGYTNYSDGWIDRQRQYFGMSADEAVAATERQIDKVNELYASIEMPTIEQTDAYNATITELENQKMDNQRDVVDDYVDDVEWYRRQNEVYGWGFMNPGETEIDTLKRAQDELWKLYEDADPTKQKEILRQIDEYDLEIFQLQQDSIDEFFNAASEAIDAAREEFNKQEEALRESWEVEDRAESKEEIQAQLDRYRYAVTKEGKDKYESLQEQMKEIEREEELYELQKKNNATIEQMEADLEAAEAEKKQIMEQVEAGTLNIQALMEKINNSNDDSSIAGVLSNILEKMDNVSIVSNSNFTQNNYNQVPDVTAATAFGNAAGRSFQYDSYGG